MHKVELAFITALVTFSLAYGLYGCARTIVQS